MRFFAFIKFQRFCTPKFQWKNVKRLGPTVSSSSTVPSLRFLNSLGDRRMVGSWEVQETSQMWFPGFPSIHTAWPCSEVSSTSCPKVKRSIPSVPSANVAYVAYWGSNAKAKKCQKAYNWMVSWISKSLLTMVKNLMLYNLMSVYILPPWWVDNLWRSNLRVEISTRDPIITMEA